MWLLEHLALQPGHLVLELAAGPGEVGFLASELVKPGGSVISSDGAEAMLEVARRRADQLGIDNVEFKRLELEWIDLPTASVDAVVCRWGLMLCLDPAAALGEARRVLRPGGRIALAVWDEAGRNPWMTLPRRALAELGHAVPEALDGPGPFALAAPGLLNSMLESAGFVEVVVETVPVHRVNANVEEFLNETLDLSRMFGDAYGQLTDRERSKLLESLRTLTAQFTGEDGMLRLPGVSLVAAASA